MTSKLTNRMDEIDIEHDAIDEYFECITACSIGDEGIHCLTQCIDIHNALIFTITAPLSIAYERRKSNDPYKPFIHKFQRWFNHLL